MGNSKHIFLQLNTTNIISEIGPRVLPPAEINAIALSNCSLFDQGHMVTGDPIVNFNIDVEQEQDIYFTILPFHLISRHKLYFTKAAFSPDGEAKIPVTIDKPAGHFMSFKITIGSKAVVGASENFSLQLMLEHQARTKLPPITISIDPVLQVSQPKP
ncbi:MAG: hypothetical protein ACERKD_06540 [Prolixibacteraceae bacterium]